MPGNKKADFIIGNIGVNAERPIPMATASAASPARALTQAEPAAGLRSIAGVAFGTAAV